MNLDSDDRSEHESPVCAPFALDNGDPLERALLLAAEAGRFDVVTKLAEELQARRLEAANVTALPRHRRR